MPFARKEKMLSTLLVLSSLALPLQVGPTRDTKYWVKLDPTTRPAQNGRPPAIVLAGTTNFPHGVRLDIEIYYEKYFTDRMLSGKAVQVLDGKFSREMVLYRNSKKNLAGPHVVRIWCYPDLQSSENRAAMGDEARRNILFEKIYHVGTPEEAEAERYVIYMRMMGFVNRFGSIFDDIKEKGRTIVGKFDRQAWKVKQEKWEDQALGIEREARGVNEFLALKMDKFVKMHLEDLRTGVSIVSNWTAIALNNPNNPLVAQMLQRKRIEQAKTMEEIRRVADPKWGNVDDIIRDLESMRTILLSALEKPADLHRETRKKKFVKILFRMQPHAPGRLHHVIISIVSELLQFFKALPDDMPEARKLHSSLDVRLQFLIANITK